MRITRPGGQTSAKRITGWGEPWETGSQQIERGLHSLAQCLALPLLAARLHAAEGADSVL